LKVSSGKEKNKARNRTASATSPENKEKQYLKETSQEQYPAIPAVDKISELNQGDPGPARP
jgi:hypothetical protein